MIIRSKRTQNFTVIPNAIMDDKSIDWKALGLLVYLLSKPDDWSVSVKQLVKAKQSGEDAIRATLNALRNAGYVVMKKHGDGSVDWMVYDTPQHETNPENPKQGLSQTGENPNREKPKQGKSPSLIKTDNRLLKTEKDKQKDFQLPEWIDSELWNDWMLVRKKKSAVNSDRAMKALISNLELIAKAGLDPNKAIETAIVKSWKTVELEFLQNQRGQTHGSSSNQAIPNQPTSAAARVSQRNQRAYQEAIAREQGDPTLYEVSGEIHTQVDFGN